MIDFKQDILFTAEECNNILQKYVDKPIDSTEVGGYISYTAKFLTMKSDFMVLNKLMSWVEGINDINIDWEGSVQKEFYLQKYDVGDKFGKHDDNAYNRLLSVGLLLNDDYEGGDLIIDLKNGEHITLNKKTGNCFMFNSMLQHEVTKIIKGSRTVVLVFFKKSQVKFKNKKFI
jgi:hypothetical protein